MSSGGRKRDEEEAGPSKRVKRASQDAEQEAIQVQVIPANEQTNQHPQPEEGERTPSPLDLSTVFTEEKLMEQSTTLVNRIPMMDKVELVSKSYDPHSIIYQSPQFKAKWKVYFKEDFHKSHILRNVDRNYVQQIVATGGAFDFQAWFNATSQEKKTDAHFRLLHHIFRTNVPRSAFIAPTLWFYREPGSFNIASYLNYVLHPPGPTLKEYKEYMTTTQQKTFTPIETFRIFDHICAACHHLHTVKPQPIVHVLPVDSHILLDCRVVALGRDQALLAGPIRLFDFQHAEFGFEEDYQAATNLTLERIQDWSHVIPSGYRRLANPFLMEAITMHTTLNNCMLYNREPTSSLLDHYPQPSLQLLNHLKSGRLMLCDQLRSYLTFTFPSNNYYEWLSLNNYTEADFKPNEIVHKQASIDERRITVQQGNVQNPSQPQPQGAPAQPGGQAAESPQPPPPPPALPTSQIYWEENMNSNNNLSREDITESFLLSLNEKMLNKFSGFDAKCHMNFFRKTAKYNVPSYEAKWRVFPAQDFAQSEIIKPEDQEFVASYLPNDYFHFRVRLAFGPTLNDQAKILHDILHNIFGVRAQRSDLIVRVLWHYAEMVGRGHLSYLLYPPLGPSLETYLAHVDHFKAIEIFRIFDHICSACSYLHQLQPMQIVFTKLNETCISLDFNASNQGREQAFLVGPIRLFNFEQAVEGTRQQFDQAKSITKVRIESWNNQSLDLNKPTNKFLAEAEDFGQCLSRLISRGFVKKTDFKRFNFYKCANLPQSMRYLVQYLQEEQLMLGPELLPFLNFASNRPDFESWTQANGYTVQDFTPNVLVYTGNSPPRKTF